tara:strand:+ start:366 stop:584 length:219 start_codon:yes stop_codon:yes gene_type:complete
MKNKLLTWAWKTTDRVDLWAQETFGIKSPKQTALELAMDLNPPKRIETALDKELGIRQTTKHYPKKKRQPKK